MTRLIDADALKTIKSIQSADFNSIETISQWIDSAPTIDTIIDIVRCQDCKYWGNLWGGSCEHPAAQIADTLHTGPTDFCSYGERREE